MPIAPTPENTLAPVSTHRSTSDDALKIGSTTAVSPCTRAPMTMPWAQAWKSGSAVQTTSSGRYSTISLATWEPFTYQPCGSMQPFGIPVVPEVYMIESSDDGSSSGDGVGASESRARWYATVSIELPPSSSNATIRF